MPLIPKGNRLIFQFAPFRVGANKLKNKCKMQVVKVELNRNSNNSREPEFLHKGIFQEGKISFPDK